MDARRRARKKFKIIFFKKGAAIAFTAFLFKHIESIFFGDDVDAAPHAKHVSVEAAHRLRALTRTKHVELYTNRTNKSTVYFCKFWLKAVS